jgi:TonB family protein
MSKAHTRPTLALLAASLCAWGAAAQIPPARSPARAVQSPTDKADTWVVVSPAGEGFGVLMSEPPTPLEQGVEAGGLSVSGRRYAAAADGQTAFIVWALRDPQEVGRRLLAADNSAEGVGGESLYLDRVAELAWELLVAPELERLKLEGDTGERAARANVGMTYERQFKLGDQQAREYSVRLEKERGLVYVCADGARIYVAAGLGAAADDPRLKLFADSFTLGGTPRVPSAGNPTLPVPSTIQVDPALVKRDPSNVPYGLPKSTATAPPSGTGSGGGPNYGGGPGGGGVDYSRPFRQNEVTRKAVIIFKPEPGFTESARRFNVVGVVRLRAVLASDGQVKHVSVVKSMPHGLTRKALDAVRVTRFEPAQKDGRAVSQYVVFEYNFNIY